MRYEIAAGALTDQACHFEAPGVPSSGQRVSSAAITGLASTRACSASAVGTKWR